MFAESHGMVADLASTELVSESSVTGVGPSSKETSTQGAGDSGKPFEGGDTRVGQQGDDLVKIAEELRAQLRTKREKAGASIEKSSRRMKARFDRHRKAATRYRVGDLVLWREEPTNQASVGLNRKLSNRYDGPFRVSKVLVNDRYLIEAIKGIRGYKRFSAVVAVDSLRRYHSVNLGEHDEIAIDNDQGKEVDRADLIDLLDG